MKLLRGHILAAMILVIVIACLVDGPARAQSTAANGYEKIASGSASDPTTLRTALNDDPVAVGAGERTAASTLALAASDVPPISATHRKPLPFRVPGKPNELERAYLDAFLILQDGSSCSKFLGGPDSVSALEQLVKQLHPTYLARTVAVRMRGPIITYKNNTTGVSFRMFRRAELNLDGSFYRGNTATSPYVPSIGGFSPNTREARVTVLLHELGHLVPSQNRDWILPDDGADPELSRRNTQRVVDECGKQIREVVKKSDLDGR